MTLKVIFSGKIRMLNMNFSGILLGVLNYQTIYLPLNENGPDPHKLSGLLDLTGRFYSIFI